MRLTRDWTFRGVTFECQYDFNSYTVEGKRLYELSLVSVNHKGVDMLDFFTYHCEDFVETLERELLSIAIDNHT